jgi:hypothetical protein
MRKWHGGTERMTCVTLSGALGPGTKGGNLKKFFLTNQYVVGKWQRI